jgi:hypothetical protein
VGKITIAFISEPKSLSLHLIQSDPLTASHAIDVVRSILEILDRSLRTRFGEHRREVIGNDANQPVARQ